MISYDIADDLIRQRVHDLLKNHGTRVQYSVFECWLEDPAVQRLRRLVQLALDSSDSVRWYPLCASCRKQVAWQGLGGPAEDPEFYLV